MKDYYKKKEIVCENLAKFLIDNNVHSELLSLKYTINDQTKNEIVTATYKSGGTRKINVSADSLIAMVRDILKNIGY